MKRVCIAYADSKMAYSLKHLTDSAKKLSLFDEVIPYTPSQLPHYLKNAELMKYPAGGGYWVWKPCTIWETLQKLDEGDVVCYIDAGCTLKKTIEWQIYFELMKDYDILFFKYPDEVPEWKMYGSSSTKIKHWTKKKALLFLDNLTGNPAWRERNKVWGGLVFAKGRTNPVVKEWLDVMLRYPEIIKNPGPEEDQFDFYAQHRHDQPLLTALAYKYSDLCLLLPDLSETYGEYVAVKATRIRCRTHQDYCIWKLKHNIRLTLGNTMVDRIKKVLR